MTDRFNAGFVNAAYVGPKAPTAPTVVTAVKGNTSGRVSFYGESSAYGPITGYRVMSIPGGFTATGASSPITVNGLTNGTSYTFQVTAINNFGESPGSIESNAVIPSPYGQEVFSYPYSAAWSWIVPTGVTSISVLAVGAGGAGGYVDYYAGGGGGLRYKNNISVTPGQTININVCGQIGGGSSTTDTTFGTNGTDAFYFYAGAGKSGRQYPYGEGGTGTTIGAGADGGGNGGNSTSYGNSWGGGGAGGYSGNGGDGGVNGNGQAGSGGGGGGGYGYNNSAGYFLHYLGNGGGVGLLGVGASGGGGYGSGPTTTEATKNGGGGSGGVTSPSVTSPGGQYGGGGGGSYVFNNNGNAGGEGAVRIIWPATGQPLTRSFPSTNTGDL
jgi:hypothetical protein